MKGSSKITDAKLEEYAMALHTDKGIRSVTEICEDVFGYTKITARGNAYKLRKNPIVAEILQTLEADDDGPMTKEAKLLYNATIIRQCVTKRDGELYARLVALDNKMQGHEKVAELKEQVTESQNAVIGQLMSMVREQNKQDKMKKVIEV